MKKLLKNFLIFFVVFLLIAGLFSTFSDQKEEDKTASLSYLAEQVKQGKVKEIVVEGEQLKVSLNNGETKEIKKETQDSLSSTLSNLGVSGEKIAQANIQVKGESGWEYWAKNLLPVLLPFLLIGAILYFMMRGVQGANSRAMSFGQSQAKQFSRDQKKPSVTFKDVAGSKEAKQELKEVIEFLKNPKKFHELGARVPKGFLLLGPPGTGKTLMARAVAGEAGVSFFHISGSEFVEMFVGVGASRVRDLFKKARKDTPCIVFIDEIDAVARKRGAGLGGSHDEREQTLNQILVEMDGFDPRTNIIVMAATNRPDVLDPALLRPGRFDRRINIDNPDIKERESILKVHAKKKPLAKEVDLKRIAERTPGFSGADLDNLLNEAAISSARRGSKKVEMSDLYDSIEKVMLGPEKRSKVMTKKEKKVTAYHEAGHALVAHNTPHTDPVQKVSVISRGQAGGYTLKVPLEDKRLHSKNEFVEELAVLVAGYMTEKEVFGDITTGASSDLQRATQLARSLVTDYGMSEDLGARTFGNQDGKVFLGNEIHENKDYSEKTAERIDEAINKFINEAAKKAGDIIKDKKDLLEQVAQALLDKETLEKEEFEKIVGKKELPEEEERTLEYVSQEEEKREKTSSKRSSN